MYYFRKLKNSKLLIAIMAIIMIFASLIISTIDDYTEFVNQQKTLDENSIDFNLALDLSDDEKEEVINELLEDEEVNLMIPGSQIRFEPGTFSIGMNLNNSNYNMPMLEGRFFEKDDFNNDKKEVVIGSEVLKSKVVTVEDGEKYIMRGIEKYKVIGVIGNLQKRTYYDYHLFYKINKFSLEEIKDVTFSITSSEIDINKLQEKLSDKSMKRGKELFINVMRFERTESKSEIFNRAVGIGGLYLVFYVSALFCALLTYLLALANYINNIKNEIIIRKVHGANNFAIFKELVGRYLAISILALLISSIISYFINIFNIFNGSSINAKSIGSISLFIIIVLIGVLFLLISQIYTNKFQPVEILKEK